MESIDRLLSTRARNFGILSALSAYASWGLLPIYWKQLAHLSPFVILAHRMVWSYVLIALILAVSKPFSQLSLTRHPPRVLVTYLISSLLIGVNWFIYIWAVNHGHVLQASLGYFLNPIVNVILAAGLFKERLGRAQKLAVLCAGAGALYLMTHAESGLWISCALASTFSAYAVIRKQAPLSSMDGMYLETFAMFPVGLAYLIFAPATDAVPFLSLSGSEMMFLFGSGVVTALPLLFFSDAAKRLSFATLGMFQYLSPTLQFLLAVFAYREPFTSTHLTSFALIWLGLGIYTINLMRLRTVTRP